MNILSAKFVKGVVSEDEVLETDIPQIAFVGRSNVGKSSVINTLANQKGLAKTSSFPGHTREINIFLVSAKGSSFYLVDLPGYGYAKASKEVQGQLQRLISWYLFDSHYMQQKVVLIIDAVVGVTETDSKMLYSLEQDQKKVLIVANKVDKLKPSEYKKKLQAIKEAVGDFPVIAYSAEKKIGVGELANQMLA